MKPRVYGIDVRGFDDDQVFELVNALRLVQPNGPGREWKLFEAYGLAATDMLRMVLGVSTVWLTNERIAFAEAMHRLALGRSCKWTRQPGWTPANPRGVEDLDESCVLDRDFLSRFALSEADWNADVFRAADFIRRLDGRPDQQPRAYLALRLFGFARPEAFFTRPQAR